VPLDVLFLIPNVRKLSYSESLEHVFSLSPRFANKVYGPKFKLCLFLLTTSELVGKSVVQIPCSIALLFLNYELAFFFFQAAMKYCCQTEWQNGGRNSSRSLRIEGTVEINISVVSVGVV